MFQRLYYHIVWTTRDREPLIDADLAGFLCRFLRSVARQERAHILEIGMVMTHVHLLVRAHPTTDLSRLLQRLKGGSSAVAGKEGYAAKGVQLRWSKGYSIETVSPRTLDAVRHYLRGQPSQHADQAIPRWTGDSPEYEAAGQEQWLGPDRAQFDGGVRRHRRRLCTAEAAARHLPLKRRPPGSVH